MTDSKIEIGGSADDLPPDLEEQLFAIHFDLPAPEQPAAFEALLAAAPAHATTMRRALQRLAGADGLVGELRDEALGPPRRGTDPKTIGGYRIERRLGEGGMGVVYLADQLEPVRRQVALKVIKLGMDTHRVLARFEIERQTLAMMSHEHIAKVFDAGTTDTGQPFFVMEYVDGEPLTRYCDRHRVDTHARLQLFAKVCAGVQHAHQKGIVHRDLKPSNILVTTQDEEPVPKIIDFGLARATDRDAIAATMFTEAGVMVGTPEYMSPEQAAGEIVDTRTDIYALGVVLYEMLVGELPIDPGRAAGRVSRAERISHDCEPPLPSRRVSTVSRDSEDIADRRATTTAGLARALRGDLDWITMKALDKDVDHRYATVNALLSDIQRHVAHEPVLAGPPSAGYRLRKFVRRNRGAVATACALLTVLVVGIVGTTIGLFEARAAERRESVARADAETHLERYDLLRNIVLLRTAREAIADLYPERPERVEAMQTWIEEHARPLVAKLPVLRAARGELRAAVPADEELRDTAAVFLDEALEHLIADLESFAAPERGDLARVEASLAWASRVESETIAAHAAAWREAIAAIAASTLYDGLVIRPQAGLIPIGVDPHSKLWEFAHPRSGCVPRRDASGVLDFDADCGLVFVLLPGGTTRLGAQASDPAGPNHDPHAVKAQGPVHSVELAPFFLSKFEMTQGQWERLTGGENPSFYRAGTWFPLSNGQRNQFTSAHPVEQVTWSHCRDLLDRSVLQLPTGSQWEYACRAGTETPWWTGRQRETLRGAVNIADRSAASGGHVERTASDAWPDFDDGWPLHAPVHTMRANAFGLHHMLGNVWEWCRDYYRPGLAARPGDGQRREGVGNRAHRGGGFMNAARDARAACYSNSAADGRWADLGLRPARTLERE